MRTLATHLQARVLPTPATIRSQAAVAQRQYMHSRSWQSTITDNFVVHTFGDAEWGKQIAKECETLRRERCAKWLREEADEVWQPSCHVVVHTYRESYLQCAGAGAARTDGTSYLKTSHKRIVVRRIDLFAPDSGVIPTALAHQLTHLVLADRCASFPMPRWIEHVMQLEQMWESTKPFKR